MDRRVKPTVRDVPARNRLLEEHFWLPGFYYRNPGRGRGAGLIRCLTFDEAMSAGRLGMIRAAELWRPELGEFSTYAGGWIRGYMVLDAEQKVHAPVHYPRRVLYERREAVLSNRGSKPLAQHPARDVPEVDDRLNLLPGLVARLPHLRRAIVEGVLAGKTFSQIALDLGIARPTAYYRWEQAVLEMREAYRMATRRKR